MSAWCLVRWLCLVLLWAPFVVLAQETLPKTQPLRTKQDLAAQMVAGIDKFLLRETDAAFKKREHYWHRDFSSVEAYERSVATNRAHLRQLIGAVDARVAVSGFEVLTNSSGATNAAETSSFTVHAVRWPVFEGVYGEGLWLRPKGTPTARVVAIPDADETPEMLVGLAPGLPPERQFARRLAEHGCEVVVPVLIDRQDTWSGSELIHRFTNQPHREWIYRQAFEVGRHIIGYEVEKVLAAVDCFQLDAFKSTNGVPNIGVAGYAEGGLIAFYAAALDPRLRAALVSGYFDSRRRLWQEPIYRNVFGLLLEFGDAEIATLIAPRSLIVEYSPVPQIVGPPAPDSRRSGAAPGRLTTPDYESVETELDRARTLLKAKQNPSFDHLDLICGNEGMATGPGADRALVALLNGLGVAVKQAEPPGTAPAEWRAGFDAAERQHRQVKELEEYTQRVCRESEPARSQFLWSKLDAHSASEWAAAQGEWKQRFWEDVIGKFPASTLPSNVKSRKAVDRPKWTGYEVMLDVFPDVFAYGYLLVPKNIPAKERRPVVVCQHGLEGLASSVFNEDPSSEDFKYYKAFAARLAEEGFVVFAPQNPYKGHDQFRALQRKANPIKKTLFSVITAQHQRILEWLGQLPFVDSNRIGLYGLSYGGATAMRVPAVLDGYALSICSANFNDWVRKNTSLDAPSTYLVLGEYEMPEFDLAHTFNYAEMAALIAPRPFMVERGHEDRVGVDEWVASEYAKVKRLYEQLGVPERTAIEYFDGGHVINGIGTFEFLHRHLAWPAVPDSGAHALRTK